jgi:hypothetical protein
MKVDAPPPLIFNAGRAAGNDGELAQAMSTLASLQSRFTDSHPDVIAQKKLVERLKAQQRGPGGEESPIAGHQSVPNPVYVNLQARLADVATNVAQQRRRLELAIANQQKARGDMAEAVTVSRQYADLDRGYAVIHKNYLDLVARREAAKLSRAVGDQEADTSFRIIEPPRMPDTPVSPNRLVLNSLVLALALAAGIALTFALHANRNAFSVSDQLSQAFDLPVLGSLSDIQSPSYPVQVRQATTAIAGSVAAMLLFYGLLAIGSYTNVIAAIRGIL